MARSRQKRSKTVAEAAAPLDAGDIDARRFDSVGTTLRGERERRGWDIAEIAQQLKIRRVHLEAIEDDRFDLVPSGTYAVNFVRAYSEALGLDSVEMVRRYRDALSGGERRLELHFPQPLPESKLPGGIILVVSIVIAALAYGAWLVMNQGTRDMLARVDPVPQQLQQVVTPPAAPPTASRGADGAPSTTASAADPPVAVPPAGAPASPAAAPPSPAPAVAAPPPVAAAPAPASPPVTAPGPPAPPAAPAVVAPPPPSASAGASAPPAAPELAAVAPSPPPPPQVTETPQGTRVFGDAGAASRIVITAQADSWVQVREASGTILFMRILKAGDVYNVPNRPGLLLTTGSAGSIELKVDGKVAPSLGNRGFVRRDVPLDPDRLLAGATGEAVRPAPGAPSRNGG